VVEHYIDTVGVRGSNPLSRTSLRPSPRSELRLGQHPIFERQRMLEDWVLAEKDLVAMMETEAVEG
jgi:hypothetical protein